MHPRYLQPRCIQNDTFSGYVSIINVPTLGHVSRISVTMSVHVFLVYPHIPISGYTP